jgi:dedicator of cytokinesis protein 3
MQGLRVCSTPSSGLTPRDLLGLQSRLYRELATQVRVWNEFYKVGYFGTGFAPQLRSKRFVYCGNDFERMADFTERITAVSYHL